MINCELAQHPFHMQRGLPLDSPDLIDATERSLPLHWENRSRQNDKASVRGLHQGQQSIRTACSLFPIPWGIEQFPESKSPPTGGRISYPRSPQHKWLSPKLRTLSRTGTKSGRG